ncbi:hypothetical protein HYH02_007581 [Chlamydomonas schloesseri]|uniref:Rubisco LSMT substrate-binding domain-containing protein n=1 Tax=Chlamydomonas schloesseri TaxID=2026947 RepID=A0A836B4V5_9CHLO|nr:hypothetical protein HYH02_007581 [Chlamydomonas schloesseri]|eukprot:KAG2447665.1 hypothetical protein HYH02_007581 [Chlamydomonas schloesseri]
MLPSIGSLRSISAAAMPSACFGPQAVSAPLRRSADITSLCARSSSPAPSSCHYGLCSSCFAAPGAAGRKASTAASGPRSLASTPTAPVWASRVDVRCRAAPGPAAPAAAQQAAGGPNFFMSTATVGSMDISTEDPAAMRLKAWVLQHSKSLPTSMTPKRRQDGTYYLAAEEPVRRGQVLVRVPRALLMNADTARGSAGCGRLIAEAGLNEWQALLLHLLCERAAGAASFWEPYIAVLPKDMSHHPLLWGPERLAWLEGSPLAAQLAERQQQVTDDTELLLVAGANELPIALEYKQATGGADELVSRDSVGWAAAVLLSRAFSLDLAEEEPLEGDMSYWGTWTAHGPDTLCLVPWADLLQHCSAAGPESCAVYQFELGAVTLAAHTNYVPGEPLFDSHGPHLSPVDLVMDYGMEEQPQGLQQLQPADAAAAAAVGNSGGSGSGGAAAGEAAGEGMSLAAAVAAAHAVDAAEGAGVAVPPSPSHSEGQQAAVAASASAVAGAGSGEGPGAEEGAEQEQHVPSVSYGGVCGTAGRDRFDANPADIVAPRSSRNAALLAALAAVHGGTVGTAPATAAAAAAEGGAAAAAAATAAGAGSLALGVSGPDLASLTFLRAALATDVELVRAGWRVKAGPRDVEAACRVMGALAEPTSTATEGALLRALAAYIQARLAAFPTCLEADEDRLLGRNGVPRVAGPERLAVVALASQKRALAGSAAAVAGWLQRLESGWPVAELYDGEEGGEVWGEGAEEEGEEDEEEGEGVQPQWDDWGGGRSSRGAAGSGGRGSRGAASGGRR